jgi:hypothetical protein
MKYIKNIFVKLVLIILCIFNTRLSAQVVYFDDLKLEIAIPARFLRIPSKDVDSIFKHQINERNESILLNAYEAIKNANYFYALNASDSINYNLFINKMSGYSKVDNVFLAKAKKSIESIETVTWRSLQIIKTKNGVTAVKLDDYVDYTDPTHMNVTYWLDDTYSKSLIAISFNNLPEDVIRYILNSIKIYEIR